MGKKSVRRGILAWLISAGIAAAVAGAVALVITLSVVALRGRESLKVPVAFTLYVHAAPFEYPAHTKLSHRDGVTYLKASGGEQQLEKYPLLLSTGELLLQRSMLWMAADSQTMKRIDYFSKIRSDDNRGGFLYDNEDTYVFLEPITLTFNDGEPQTFEAPVVVQVEYRQHVHVYGPHTAALYERLEQDRVTATFHDKREIHLESDIYYEPNSVWRLLFVPMELLDAAQ